MKIELGRKNLNGAMPMPCSNTSDGPAHYPTLYISDISESLPEGGEITFKFKKVSETKSNRNGEKTHSVDLEMREICDVKGAKSKKDDAGENLDRLADEAEEESEDKEND